jgi:hypothetical protein
MSNQEWTEIEAWGTSQLQGKQRKLKAENKIAADDNKKNCEPIQHVVTEVVRSMMAKFEPLANPNIPEEWREKAGHGVFSLMDLQRLSSPQPPRWRTTPQKSLIPKTPPTTMPSTRTGLSPAVLTAGNTTSNPSKSDLRTRVLTIKLVDGEDQLISLVGMGKRDGPIEEIWDLDHNKFLEELKNDFGFDSTRHTVYGFTPRARCNLSTPGRYGSRCCLAGSNIIFPTGSFISESKPRFWLVKRSRRLGTRR